MCHLPDALRTPFTFISHRDVCRWQRFRAFAESVQIVTFSKVFGPLALQFNQAAVAVALGSPVLPTCK
jgi:hypothetical protein